MKSRTALLIIGAPILLLANYTFLVAQRSQPSSLNTKSTASLPSTVQPSSATIEAAERLDKAEHSDSVTEEEYAVYSAVLNQIRRIPSDGKVAKLIVVNDKKREPPPGAKDWRGIVPLHSTREDVERLLGPPPPPPSDGTRIYKASKVRSIYFLEEGEIYIVFAEKDSPVERQCLAQVPASTVLLIQIKPKKNLYLSDLKLQKDKLKRFDPAEPPNSDFDGFVNEEEGISVRAQKGVVQLINYFAAARDTDLCPSYYTSPKWFCGVLVHLVNLILPPLTPGRGEIP
jgi:hypothetical protein